MDPEEKFKEWDRKMALAHGFTEQDIQFGIPAYALKEEFMEKSGMTRLECRNWGVMSASQNHRITLAGLIEDLKKVMRIYE